MSIEHHEFSLIARAASLNVQTLGHGKPVLLLHSGAGPGSMMPLASALEARSHVILPTMPGFDDQPRQAGIVTIGDVATLYLSLLEQMRATDVTIIGNSVGGWIAAEMALRKSPRVSGIVLLDAIGLDPSPEGGAVLDPLKLGPAVGAYAFHDPQRFGTPPDEAAAERIRRNQQVLLTYAGEPFMNDPTLRRRLPKMPVPSLVIWGESDRIVTPAYGYQFAQLMPNARFKLVPQAGHFPQIEATAVVVESIAEFVGSVISMRQS
ncbi:alpha/beta fold hydrolase [Granulibacter bethesdensis]|uniref:alpha/beta fold hydrolase n=1 Tax=Granulibacter bethesdensis TaxID=364410 RepID=UPI0012FD0A36|nr:alpha/beta hydrolase [Granulibacter bethesdensis]